LYYLASLGTARGNDSGNARLELGVAQLFLGRAGGGLGRFNRCLLCSHLLLRLIIALPGRVSALQQLRLSFKCRSRLSQQGLRRDENGLGGIETGSLHLRIEPRQHLISRETPCGLTPSWAIVHRRRSERMSIVGCHRDKVLFPSTESFGRPGSSLVQVAASSLPPLTEEKRHASYIHQRP